MKWIKLTALPISVFAVMLLLASCEPDAEMKKVTDYQKNDIPMTGAKNIPISVSSATGKLNIFYTKETRTLNYSMNWTGLSGAPTSIGIFGLAPEGYIVTPGSPAVQALTTTGLTATNKTSGTLLADGFVVKEQDLLNGMYYIVIRTAAYPNGEIRAQIKFD